MSLSTTQSFPSRAYCGAALTASGAQRPGRNPSLCALHPGSQSGVLAGSNHCGTNRSCTVGIPSLRVPPLGLGISTRLTGLGM